MHIDALNTEPDSCPPEVKPRPMKTISTIYNRWIIPFLCQPSVELLYNMCVRVALVNRHNKQILSRVPLAYRLTCTIYDIVDQSLGLRKGPSGSKVANVDT